MSAALENVDDFTCAVCLEVLEDPRELSCTHVFCVECVEGLGTGLGARCPVCRVTLEPGHQAVPQDLVVSLAAASAACPTCAAPVKLSEMRRHVKQCTPSSPLPAFQPVGATSQPIPQAVNRDTFSCPYCQKAHMDSEVLVSHCNARHKHDPRHVVCPICVSMPWGDPHMVSSNFISHLNARHRFEYHTYVSYDQDDDQMLQAAIAASMQKF